MRHTARHTALSRSLRIVALAWAVSILTGCTANTWQRISPDPKGYQDQVANVTSAHQRDDGSVVVCVTGKPAAIPAFVGENPDEAFSLILPADTTGRVFVDAHPSLRRYGRYGLTAAELAGPCGDSVSTEIALPVHTLRHSDLGYSEHDAFQEIPKAAMADLIDKRAESPAVYVFITNDFGRAHRNIVYVAPEARFDGARAVLMEPGPRPLKGNPAYIAALPVAVVIDVLMAPVYLYYAIRLASVH